MIRFFFTLALAWGLSFNAQAIDRTDLQLKPSTPLLAGAGSDSGGASLAAKIGYVALGSAANVGALLLTLPYFGAAEGPAASIGVVALGLGLWTVVLKADGWLFGVDRSWASAAVGSALGMVSGFAIGFVMVKAFGSGQGFQDIAGALVGIVFGGAISSTLWTLGDPFGLTPCCEDCPDDKAALLRPMVPSGQTGRLTVISVPLVAGAF